jgi:hypothetical protein
VTSHETARVRTRRWAVYTVCKADRKQNQTPWANVAVHPNNNFILVRYVFPVMKHVRNDKLKFPVTLSLHPKNNKTGKKLNVIN